MGDLPLGRSAKPMSSDQLCGVIPVLATPFSADGEVDVSSFRRLAAHVFETGVTAVMFPGFASEFYKLSGDERDLLLGVLLDEAATHRDVTVIASVSEQATRLAVAEACRAVERGASACNLLPPFTVVSSPDALRRHIDAFLRAVEPVPVIVQIAPGLTGIHVTVEDLRSLALAHENFRIVKVEMSPAGPFLDALAAGTPTMYSLIGYGGVQLPDGLRRGAAGVQPGSSFTELYQLIWTRWATGDESGAVSLHSAMLPYLSYWMQDIELLIAAEKLIACRRDLIEYDHCRLPSWQLDRREIAMVDSFVEKFATRWGS